MYKNQLKKPSHFDFDLIVIGSGAGGGIAAHSAAEMGKKVAIIEDRAIGGESVHSGCVPTKALLQAAEVYETTKTASKFGITASAVTFNYASIKSWKDTAVYRTGGTDEELAFKHEHITLIHGHAHFLSPWIISVGSKRLHAKKFLIATGTHSLVPDIDGLKEVGFITHKEAVNLTRPPKSLFIIGGGSIGCEFAHLFSTFESKVHLADIAPRLLCNEDKDVGEMLSAVFESRGVRVHVKTKILAVRKQADRKVVYFMENGVKRHVLVDEILLAAGKKANVDIGLENAGVGYNESSIPTNLHMQTNVPHIYAAGGVVGPYNYTHMAAYQSKIAVYNMFHRKKAAADYHAVPRCVYVSPEVACVGANEAELKAHKIPFQIAKVPTSIITRSNTSNMSTGFVKIIASHTGVLLGASIVAPRAGEMIHELTLAIHRHHKASDITRTIHAFPSWSEAVLVCASKIR